MKGLDIINERIEELKESIQDGHKWLEEFEPDDGDYLDREYAVHWDEELLEDLLQIKQDLENKEKLEKNYDKLKVEIYDTKEENKELKQNLAKFDNEHFQQYFKCVRAFLILKDYIVIGKSKITETGYALYDSIDTLVEITKEEYELLEELKGVKK